MDILKQKFQETQKFHVGKGKCLSVWSMEMSANLKLAMGGYSPKEMNYSMNLMIF